MNTAELIAQHAQQLSEAQQLAGALNSEWEQAARSGSNCEAIEDKQENTARLIKRLELRIEQLHIEAANEAEADRISQAGALRDQVICKYGDLAKQYVAIKVAAGKLQAQMEKFNQDAAAVIEGDIRKLKQLGGEALPREVSQILLGQALDVREFDSAWRGAHYMASSGLESGAYQIR